MTKRIATVAVALGLALTAWVNREHTPAPSPDVPLDKAWHFCSCSAPVFGHFRSAPLHTDERLSKTEWT